jgi:hypothetical protein
LRIKLPNHFLSRFFGMVQISSVGVLPLSIWTSYFRLGHGRTPHSPMGVGLLFLGGRKRKKGACAPGQPGSNKCLYRFTSEGGWGQAIEAAFSAMSDNPGFCLAASRPEGGPSGGADARWTQQALRALARPCGQ